MKRFTLYAVLLFVLSYALFCSAQEARSELYAGYSFTHVDLAAGAPVASSLHGWDVSHSVNIGPNFAVEAEGVGSYQSISNVLIQDYAVMAGPRLNYKHVFVHGLFGFNHLRGSGYGESASDNSFAMALGGGTVVPISERWGIRTSLDYVMTKHNLVGTGSVTENNFRAGAGVVFFLGGRGRKMSSAAMPSARREQPSGTISLTQLGVHGYWEERGFVVTALVASSPLQGVGVTPNDILFSVDGKKVQSLAELRAAIPQSGPVKIGFLFGRTAPVERTVTIK